MTTPALEDTVTAPPPAEGQIQELLAELENNPPVDPDVLAGVVADQRNQAAQQQAAWRTAYRGLALRYATERAEWDALRTLLSERVDLLTERLTALAAAGATAAPEQPAAAEA